jgi:SAM-dependent methyltransferase
MVVGCDLSFGMLQAVSHDALVNADVMALPFASKSLDVVLAPHMLYEVSDVESALLEVRRVLKPGGALLAVTNGANHARSLRALIEESVRESTPGWMMHDPASRQFSLENGASQLAAVFDSISCTRPSRSLRVVLKDANVVANFVASVGDRYESEIRVPWTTIVDEVRRKVRRIIGEKGSFMTSADVGVFICH